MRKFITAGPGLILLSLLALLGWATPGGNCSSFPKKCCLLQIVFGAL